METMGLSEQVKISLENAENSLREALSFAAKVEEPKINISISQILESTTRIKNFYDNKSLSMEEVIRRQFGI